MGALEVLLEQASGPAASWAIRDARQSLELSQKDFAQLLSQKLNSPVKQTTVASWELGDRQPPVNALIAAARLAGMSVEEALTGPPRLMLQQRLHVTIQKLERLPRGSASARRIERELNTLRERLRSPRSRGRGVVKD